MRRCPIHPTKVRFVSEKQACAESRRIQIEDGMVLHVFHCDWCEGWHFTNKSKERE